MKGKANRKVETKTAKLGCIARQTVRLKPRLPHQVALTPFSLVLIMSTLQNEVLLENIYEELMAELIDTETLAKYSQDDINFEVNRRFQDLSN